MRSLSDVTVMKQNKKTLLNHTQEEIKTDKIFQKSKYGLLPDLSSCCSVPPAPNIKSIV